MKFLYCINSTPCTNRLLCQKYVLCAVSTRCSCWNRQYIPYGTLYTSWKSNTLSFSRYYQPSFLPFRTTDRTEEKKERAKEQVEENTHRCFYFDEENTHLFGDRNNLNIEIFAPNYDPYSFIRHQSPPLKTEHPLNTSRKAGILTYKISEQRPTQWPFLQVCVCATHDFLSPFPRSWIPRYS